MSESIFTKIVNREIGANIIYEDENHLAFLDIAPFEKGHTLVIPKKEYVTIMDMSEDEFLALMSVVYKVANHLEAELDCGINILQNNRVISGQEVMHVHFHVIPRLENKNLCYLKNGTKYLNNEVENYTRRLKLN